MLINPLDVVAEEIAAFTEQRGRAPYRLELSLRAANDIRKAVADSYGLTNVHMLSRNDVGTDASTFMFMGVECHTTRTAGYFIQAR